MMITITSLPFTLPIEIRRGDGIVSKFCDFYEKLISDESTRKRAADILNGKTMENASDEQLEALSVIAGELGYSITVSEAREFLDPEEAALNDDDLDAVAGGKGDHYETKIIVCQVGGKPEVSESGPLISE